MLQNNWEDLSEKKVRKKGTVSEELRGFINYINSCTIEISIAAGYF
jgi:hypothetical protein